MMIRSMSALLLAAGLYSQPTIPALPPEGRQIEIDPANPKGVVATLDGKDVTGEEFQQLVVGMDQKAKDAARNNAVEMLRYVGWLRRMGAEAEKRGLHRKEPLKTQIEIARIQLLSNAIVQQHELEEVVTPFEQRGYYQANKDAYTSVKLKLIYLPFVGETEELQAKRKMEEIHKKLKGGANFVALVKEYSKHEESREKDGDYGEIRLADQIPQPVKDVAFALKDGEFSAPTRLANGYYLFLRTSAEIDPYDKVKDSIFTQIKQDRNAAWVDGHRKAVAVAMKPASASKDPKRIVATLEGQPVTAADVERLLAAMEEKMRTSLKAVPEEMLRGIGFMRRMAKVAEEAKLDQTGAARLPLEMTRLQALSSALIADEEMSMKVTEEELKKIYAENLKFVSKAKLKIVFFDVPEGNMEADPPALKLAKEVREKIRGGADFVEMVKQYSKDPVSREKDGDYGPLQITDDGVPGPAKAAIWALPVGAVSEPVRLQNGYYLFKLLALEELGLETVRADLTKRIRTMKNRDWLSSMRAQVQVKLAK